MAPSKLKAAGGSRRSKDPALRDDSPAASKPIRASKSSRSAATLTRTSFLSLMDDPAADKRAADVSQISDAHPLEDSVSGGARPGERAQRRMNLDRRSRGERRDASERRSCEGRAFGGERLAENSRASKGGERSAKTRRFFRASSIPQEARAGGSSFVFAARWPGISSCGFWRQPFCSQAPRVSRAKQPLQHPRKARFLPRRRDGESPSQSNRGSGVSARLKSPHALRCILLDDQRLLQGGPCETQRPHVPNAFGKVVQVLFSYRLIRPRLRRVILFLNAKRNDAECPS